MAEHENSKHENEHHKIIEHRHNNISETHEHHRVEGAHATFETEEEKRPEVDSKKSLKYALIIVVVIIVALAVIVVLSKYVFTNNNTVTYNHYVFEKFEGNKWMTQQSIKEQLYNIPFYYNPTQVLDIPIDSKSIDTIRAFSMNPDGKTYIVIDPDESSKIIIAGVEYARILGTGYNIYNMNVSSGISKPVTQATDSPVITCRNQSKNTLVIYQTVTDKNLVSVNNNCILIESKSVNESIRVADAFSFRLLNIIQE